MHAAFSWLNPAAAWEKFREKFQISSIFITDIFQVPHFFLILKFQIFFFANVRSFWSLMVNWKKKYWISLIDCWASLVFINLIFFFFWRRERKKEILIIWWDQQVTENENRTGSKTQQTETTNRQWFKSTSNKFEWNTHSTKTKDFKKQWMEQLKIEPSQSQQNKQMHARMRRVTKKIRSRFNHTVKTTGYEN